MNAGWKMAGYELRRQAMSEIYKTCNIAERYCYHRPSEVANHNATCAKPDHRCTAGRVRGHAIGAISCACLLVKDGDEGRNRQIAGFLSRKGNTQK